MIKKDVPDADDASIRSTSSRCCDMICRCVRDNFGAGLLANAIPLDKLMEWYLKTRFFSNLPWTQRAWESAERLARLVVSDGFSKTYIGASACTPY